MDAGFLVKSLAKNESTVRLAHNYASIRIDRNHIKPHIKPQASSKISGSDWSVGELGP